MSILEILEAHRVSAFAGADTACACDRTWRSNADYRAHVAQVLEQHEREAKVEAVRESARYLNRIMPNGLVNPISVLADLDVAADRISRGLHANGQDRKTS